MIKTIAFSCLLLASAAVAQDDVPAEDNARGDAPEVTAEVTADSTAAAETEPSPQEKKAKTDPYDYRSSEQISEDASVSFPVDI